MRSASPTARTSSLQSTTRPLWKSSRRPDLQLHLLTALDWEYDPLEHGARKHAKYSGSNAHRFSVCSGQVALAAKIGVEISGPDAEKGTAAHELLDECIKSNSWCGNPGHPHHNAIIHVLDYVASLRLRYPDLIVESEIYRQFPQSIVPPDDAAGLIDVWCWSPAARIAWVIDFKNGVGETVDVEGNMQLLFYGTAALWCTPFSRAFLVVIQPNSFRGSEPREIEVTGLDLVEYQADIENAIKAAESPDAVLIQASIATAARQDTAAWPARDRPLPFLRETPGLSESSILVLCQHLRKFRLSASPG